MKIFRGDPTQNKGDQMEETVSPEIIENLKSEVNRSKESIEKEFNVNIELPTFAGFMRAIKGKLKKSEGEIAYTDLVFQKEFLKEVERMLTFLKKEVPDVLTNLTEKLTITIPTPSGKLANWVFNYFEHRSRDIPPKVEAGIQTTNMVMMSMKMLPILEFIAAAYTLGRVGFSLKPVVDDDKEGKPKLYLFNNADWNDVVFRLRKYSIGKKFEKETKTNEEDKRRRTWFKGIVGYVDKETDEIKTLEEAKFKAKELRIFLEKNTPLHFLIPTKVLFSMQKFWGMPFWFGYAPRDMYFYKLMFQWLSKIKNAYTELEKEVPGFNLKFLGKRVNCGAEGKLRFNKIIPSRSGEPEFRGETGLAAGRIYPKIILPMDASTEDIKKFFKTLWEDKDKPEQETTQTNAQPE